MKSLKEFKPLVRLLKDEKGKLILASFIIFLSSIAEIFTGYLNGSAVTAITNMEIGRSLMFLGIL